MLVERTSIKVKRRYFLVDFRAKEREKSRRMKRDVLV